ncbi:MAG: hypothetical protein KGM47_14730 [Acidobacteriota bacterium]|nr:hypothetical protein [Acidobacteriota bacterium]
MNASAEAQRGLLLPRKALRRLAEAGIFAQPSVTLEYQQLAMRYVVRGVESGGAVEAFGRYVTFCGEQGEALAWLHPLDAIGVNGVHALVVAPVLVRVEMFRRGHTYDLLITRHAPGTRANGKRPGLESTTLFRALAGYLELDLTRPKKNRNSLPIAAFFTRAGEPLSIPSQFGSVIRTVTLGANCCGCVHSHYLRAPEAASSPGIIADRIEAVASPEDR